MLLAADNIHAMNPIVSDALRRLDPDPIRDLALTCERNGAQLIDLNPGYLAPRHEDRMQFLVETVQEETPLRLILDSPNARVLARGLRACRDTPILNALSLEPQKIQEILPLAVEYGTDLVLLLMDERSFTPPTTDEKIALALELREHALSAGMNQESLIFDPVLPNLSWDDAWPRIAEDVRTVRLLATGAVLQEPVRTMVGLSNLRSGHSSMFPAEIDVTCLTLLAGAGLHMALASATNAALLERCRMLSRLV
jgi:5-methyltetrahydrofolate corrinoid/iron sulfur protein methyltransferase